MTHRILPNHMVLAFWSRPFPKETGPGCVHLGMNHFCEEEQRPIANCSSEERLAFVSTNLAAEERNFPLHGQTRPPTLVQSGAQPLIEIRLASNGRPS